MGHGDDVSSSRRWGQEPGRSAGRFAALACASILLANCAGPQTLSGNGSEKRYGVKASPRVVAEGDPVPKGGGRDLVGKAYVVGGRTYVPNASRYKSEGWASWYGTAFHGRLTANGEVFDRESVAAAHPTMPLPSYVRVTNTLNRRSMIVRVNDRGPYERDRILDVSERVAEALDFRRRGTARVRIEYVGRASLRGSDDAKLLATLTTDGSPAPFGGKRIMLADLRDEPPPRRAVPVDEPPRPTVLVAEASPPVRETVPDERLAAPQPGVTVGAAEAAANEPEPADHPLPPRRPGTGTIRVASADERPAKGEVPASSRQDEPAEVHLLPPQRPHLTGIY